MKKLTGNVKANRRGLPARKKRATMTRAFELLAALPEDLKVPGRKEDKPQKRKGL
jgi:hypothetical protein